MLLPRGKKEMGQPEVGPGFYPPVMHQLSVPEDPEQWAVETSYSITHNVEAMAKKGIARGKKHNLMAQVIPIYGFGILLYILYIIYKLTCKGKTNKSGGYTTVNKGHMEIPITDSELARLQERLLQTERMMDRIVSGKGSGSGRRRRSKTTVSKKEEKLLKQLRQLTQLMQESRLEGASPEMEAEEVPYGADWEGYPEETYPEYDKSCDRREIKTVRLEVPTNQPTAEALAERMEQEEEEIMARKLSIVQEEDEEEKEEEEDREEDEEDDEEEDVEEIEGDMEEIAEDIVEEDDDEEEEEVEIAERRQLLSPRPSRMVERKQERIGLEVSKEMPESHSGGKKQISFSDHKDVFHYPKEGTYEEEEEEEEEETEAGEEDEGTEVEEEEADEEDPVMEAESLQFSCEGCPNPEEEAEEDKEYLLTAPAEGDARIHADVPTEVSGLRMRNRRET